MIDTGTVPIIHNSLFPTHYFLFLLFTSFSAKIRLYRILAEVIIVAYIHRTLENSILDISNDYSCLLLLGPRQVGKTTVLEYLMKNTARKKVTLDDVTERRLAQSDPELFLETHPAPVLIDEVQYAPELFSYLKIRIDQGAAPGSWWLTGSQSFELMKLAQESLAGRTAILHMSALSQSELYGSGVTEPLSISFDQLIHRKEFLSPCSPQELYERIWHGGMPGHRSGKFRDRDVFYSSYIQTYINRDVSDMIPGVDKLLFADFIRAAACRASQMLNVHDIAQDISVSDDTAKRWLQVLEKSEVIFYLRPYSNNLLKRTVKTPKMYFFDTGLVAYLTRYFKLLDRSSVPRGTGAILCLRDTLSAIDRNTFIVPVWMI